MLFSSLEFLYLFLPITLILYFACPLRWRNAVLLVVSLIFYGSGEPIYLFLMIFTIAADYIFGILTARAARRGGRPRAILVFAIVFNLSLLGFFKYYDFLAANVGMPVLGVKLPIGISFYTFQALSYVIDVYRGEAEEQRSIVDFGTYVTLFPQLIAGPIVRYSEIDGQLKGREHTASRTAEGIAAFCAGLSKKVLLANGAGEMAQKLKSVIDSGEYDVSVLCVWLWIVFYSFQIYFDFSGYSDMAVGLGRIFGFDFPENFRYPYVSQSITEFWRRWHITLSSWFREYVYIPLGGNRKGKARTYLNLFVVWSLTGLWHGAAWNFLLWGIYFFIILALEKAFFSKLLARCPRPVRHVYALFFILLGWLIFASDGAALSDITRLTLRLFGIGCTAFSDGWSAYELLRNLPFIAIMTIACTPLPKALGKRLRAKCPPLAYAFRSVLCIASLILCTAYLVDSGYNPFLYFRF